MKGYKKNKNYSRFSGSAIAFELIIIAVVLIILTSVLQFVSSQIKYSSYVEVRERTFHVAESGIYFYKWYLAHQIEGKNQNEIEDFWNNGPLGVGSSYVKDFLDNSGEKIGETEISISFPSGNHNIVEIISTGKLLKRPEITRTIKAVLRRSIWSDFAIMSDAPICLDKYWTINGKIIGNNGVHFNGKASNMVMAGVSSYNDTNPLHAIYNGKTGVWTEMADPASVFTAGTRYPVPKKDFTGVASVLQTMKEEAQSPGGATLNSCTDTGCYFDDSGEGYRVILNDDTFDICIVNEYWESSSHNPKKYREWESSQKCNDCSGDCLRSFNIPDTGVIFVEGNVWLEGTIDAKRISIAAASVSDPADNSTIFIMNNVAYTNFDGSDVAGILAEGDIEILKDAPDDIEIDGVLLTQNGSVSKPEYNSECCGTGCTEGKNSLDVFGCVLTKGGINFGFHKASCPNTDMANRTITYDKNLYSYPPPFFPADSFYYVDFWEEI